MVTRYIKTYYLNLWVEKTVVMCLPEQTSTRAASVLRRTSGSDIQTLRRLRVRPLDDVQTMTPSSSSCC